MIGLTLVFQAVNNVFTFANPDNCMRKKQSKCSGVLCKCLVDFFFFTFESNKPDILFQEEEGKREQPEKWKTVGEIKKMLEHNSVKQEKER